MFSNYPKEVENVQHLHLAAIPLSQKGLAVDPAVVAHHLHHPLKMNLLALMTALRIRPIKSHHRMMNYQAKK